MKHFIVLVAMLLSFSGLKAQISDVQQKGNNLYVYDENNKKLSEMYLGSSDKYLGMTSSFFVVKKGTTLYTYDYKSKMIGQMRFEGEDKFRNAAGNSFNIEKYDHIYTYDKNCKLLRERRK